MSVGKGGGRPYLPNGGRGVSGGLDNVQSLVVFFRWPPNCYFLPSKLSGFVSIQILNLRGNKIISNMFKIFEKQGLPLNFGIL